MVAICLLVMAASAIGWKMHHMIAKKQFRSLVERLHSRMQTCRQLSINMQSDWEAVLKRERDRWIFECRCVDDPEAPTLPSLVLDSFVIMLDGKETKDRLVFSFAASGDISPGGFLQIQSKTGDQVGWKMLDLLHLDKGSKLGPMHPEDLR